MRAGPSVHAQVVLHHWAFVVTSSTDSRGRLTLLEGEKTEVRTQRLPRQWFTGTDWRGWNSNPKRWLPEAAFRYQGRLNLTTWNVGISISVWEGETLLDRTTQFWYGGFLVSNEFKPHLILKNSWSSPKEFAVSAIDKLWYVNHVDTHTYVHTHI